MCVCVLISLTTATVLCVPDEDVFSPNMNETFYFTCCVFSVV